MRALVFLVAVSLSLSCSRKGEEGEVLEVYAASSLRDALGDAARAFEEEHPDVEVRVTAAGSQTLRHQIEQGAEVDVFASADEEHLRALETGGLMGDVRRLATTDLVVIAPVDGSVRSFEDLDRADAIVLGAPEVPIGRYSRRVLRQSEGLLGSAFAREVESRVVSEESNVRLVRAKVELGAADAAIVYRSDAVRSAKVRLVEIPAAANVEANLFVGVHADSPRGANARRFVQFLTSEAGRRSLEAAGFRSP